MESKGDRSVFDMWVVELGKARFLDLIAPQDRGDSKTWRDVITTVPVHYFMRIGLENHRLYVRHPCRAREFVRITEAAGLGCEETDDGRILLTSDTSQLQELFRRNADALFPKPGPQHRKYFVRVKP
jgi:hypothetical protein